MSVEHELTDSASTLTTDGVAKTRSTVITSSCRTLLVGNSRTCRLRPRVEGRQAVLGALLEPNDLERHPLVGGVL